MRNGDIIVTFKSGKQVKGRGTLNDKNTAQPYIDYGKKPYPSSLDMKNAASVRFEPDMGKAIEFNRWEYFFQGGWVGPRLKVQRH